MDFEKNSEILKIMGHPIRLKILFGLLSDNECNVSMIVDKLGIPQSTASQHLALLKSRNLIQPRKDGLKICYRVVDARVDKIMKILEQ